MFNVRNYSESLLTRDTLSTIQIVRARREAKTGFRANEMGAQSKEVEQMDVTSLVMIILLIPVIAVSLGAIGFSRAIKPRTRIYR